MSSTNVNLGGTRHCCVCTGVCGHIGPVQLCAQHGGQPVIVAPIQPAIVQQPIGMHPCRFHRRADPFAQGVEQYQIRCRCHEDTYSMWRPAEDGPYHCPATGAVSTGE